MEILTGWCRAKQTPQHSKSDALKKAGNSAAIPRDFSNAEVWAGLQLPLKGRRMFDR